MPNTASLTVAGNVKAEMARRSVTQTEMSRQINLSQSQLSKRLAGVIPFDVDELNAIATVLCLPVETFLHGVEGSAA